MRYILIIALAVSLWFVPGNASSQDSLSTPKQIYIGLDVSKTIGHLCFSRGAYEVPIGIEMQGYVRLYKPFVLRGIVGYDRVSVKEPAPNISYYSSGAYCMLGMGVETSVEDVSLSFSALGSISSARERGDIRIKGDYFPDYTTSYSRSGYVTAFVCSADLLYPFGNRYGVMLSARVGFNLSNDFDSAEWPNYFVPGLGVVNDGFMSGQLGVSFLVSL
jgi:hypothetical protein